MRRIVIVMATLINPVVKGGTKPPKKETMPVHIKCIVDDLGDKHAFIPIMRDYCNKEKSIMFSTREYNSSKYSEDRDIIVRLPAFHAYINGQYMRTFYPNTRPYQHVEECISEYVKRKTQIEIRRSRPWFFVAWYNKFMALFRYQTRMERAAEEEKKQQAKRLQDLKTVANLDSAVVEMVSTRKRRINEWS
jgi:hypothetical protein